MDFDAIANLLAQLSVRSPTTSSFERVLMTILKTHPTQVLSDFNSKAQEIEKLANLNPSDLIKCRMSQNTCVFEYEVSSDKLEEVLTCIPRIKIGTSIYKLYTKVTGYYRVQLNHLTFAALKKENMIRKLFDLCEQRKRRNTCSFRQMQLAEAMGFKSEVENRTEIKAYNQEKNGNKSPPNETNKNENENEKEAKYAEEYNNQKSED